MLEVAREKDAGLAAALDNAIVVAESSNGTLIDKPDLKTTMKYRLSQASRIGLTGARIFPAFAARGMGTRCDSSLSGAGIQREGSAGACSNGAGAW